MSKRPSQGDLEDEPAGSEGDVRCRVRLDSYMGEIATHLARLPSTVRNREAVHLMRIGFAVLYGGLAIRPAAAAEGISGARPGGEGSAPGPVADATATLLGGMDLGNFLSGPEPAGG